MLNEVSIDKVYLACGATDLRKSIDGLAVLVKEGFELDRTINLKFSTGITMGFGYITAGWSEGNFNGRWKPLLHI